MPALTRLLPRCPATAVALSLGLAAGCAAAQSVQSFTVVNADTGADVATFVGTGTVSIANLPRLNVRANATGAVSVVLAEGGSSRTEGTAPFALKGDSGGRYFPWSPAPGTYVITATPYAGAGATGRAGAEARLTLTVTRETSPPAPPPSPPTGTLPSGYSQCATEGQRCSFTGSASVVYGSGNVWTLPRSFSNGVECTNAVFGDPLPGTFKSCYVKAGTPPPPPPPPPPPATGSGKLRIDPDSVHHFVYDRDNDGDGKLDPAYLAGSGGPEGFLYESPSRRTAIINRLLRSNNVNAPVNGLYFHATRAFGGDGNSFETPFNNNADPRSGLSASKIAAWRTDLKRLDDAGVILWINLFDDHATPYGCKFNSEYQRFAQDFVNQFKDLKHIVWVTQEEYRWPSQGSPSQPCSEADSDARQRGLAAAIRSVDPIHPIATHHMNGQAMAFPNDPNIRVFGQQTYVRSPEDMHDRTGQQGWGNWVYVMAEAHSWHQDLIDAELTRGEGRTLMRRSNWATAMSGGYVMMYNSFECNNGGRLCNDNGPNDSDPTDAMLDDLRRLRLFMESTTFNRMTPLFDNDGALSRAKLDGTKYILANAGLGHYILYGDNNTGKLGVRNAPVGSYALRWFDPATGNTVNQTADVAPGGLASFTKPGGIGNEAVLFLRKR